MNWKAIALWQKHNLVLGSCKQVLGLANSTLVEIQFPVNKAKWISKQYNEKVNFV
jgi:hypothetical protein